MIGNRLLIVVCSLVSTGFIVSGCSGDKVSQPVSSDVSESYYAYLTSGKHIDRAEAQPVFPVSGELYSENTSVFRLNPAKVTARQALQLRPILSDFALYSPSVAPSKHVASTVSDMPSIVADGIPSIKKNDIIPVSCSGLSAIELRECLDNLGVSSAPESEHVSLHDPQSLKIQLGPSIEDSILKKSMLSITTNVSKTDRDSIIATLTDFTNNDSAHANIDIASFNPFELSGFSLSNVTITDNSSSDINADGALEAHSTMITEIMKPVNYSRTASEMLDSCITKYRGTTIDDRYVMKLTTYVHLDNLKAQRQVAPVIPDNSSGDTIDFNASLKNYAASLDVMAINQAFDANIIKSIYSSSGTLPWSSTEYSFMFQLAPDLINGAYNDVLSQISDSNDIGCQEIVEQHINPRTAIISGVSPGSSNLQKSVGASLSVMYQVPVVYSRQLTAKFAQALLGDISATDEEAPLQDYCTVDGNGQKVAIIDPVSGAIVPACEKIDKNSLAKVVLYTKSGACKGDKNDWAYYPAQMRSPRFGRGIQYILTEWLIHNQVGDYKNIHVYQNLWKSAFQVAVRGGKIAVATYLQGQLTSAKFATAAAPDILFITDAVMKYAATILKYADFNLAKYRFKVPSDVIHFLASGTGSGAHLTGDKKTGYAAFLAKLATKSNKSMVVGFLIERFTDSIAQILDVTVVGWQDLSDGSHNGCFKFD